MLHFPPPWLSAARLSAHATGTRSRETFVIVFPAYVCPRIYAGVYTQTPLAGERARANRASFITGNSNRHRYNRLLRWQTTVFRGRPLVSECSWTRVTNVEGTQTETTSSIRSRVFASDFSRAKANSGRPWIVAISRIHEVTRA